MKTPKKSTSECRQLSEIAIFWANKAFKETSLTKTHFAELLSEHSQAQHFFDKVGRLTPIEQGIKTQSNNLKKLQRYLNYEKALPLDLIIAWCDCLPAPYGDKLRTEIGFEINPINLKLQSIKICIKEMGEGITALAIGDKNTIIKELQEAREAINAVLGGSDD
ncbi:MAG: hypothetical protein KGV56_00390 [Gammaproteobacteria bacterium]|nr:hypothetical protein [Gammaproteobacteria bacterium]